MAVVLVTGGAGYVGSHCAKALAEHGHHVVVVDNLSTGRRDFLKWGTFVEADIRNPAAMEAVLARKIDAVLHFAGFSSVHDSIVSPGAYYDVNVQGTRVLLDAMAKAGVKALVFSSSCAMYGQPRQIPITETCPCDPLNPYGMSKLVCERMIGDFQRAYGMKPVCLRYFNAAGADKSGELGEDHANETRLIPLALDAVSGRGPPLSILGTDYDTRDGTAIRDYIHVVDLIEGHLRALDHLLRGGETATLNLGTGTGFSVREVLSAVGRICAREVPVQLSARRRGDPAVLVADASKAHQILGWVPRQSDLNTIVSDAWHWHKRRFS